MAFTKLAKRTAPVVHRRKGPSPALVKAQRALQAARKAARKPPKADFLAPALSAAAGAAFAFIDVRHPRLSSFKGVPVHLLYGLGAVTLGTMVHATSKGTVGQVLRETGSAGLALGIYGYARSKLESSEKTEGDFEDTTEGDFEDD